MTIYTLYIVNKAGGLIYNRDITPGPKLDSNEHLTRASTFHGLHLISKQLAPVASAGVHTVETPSFTVHCLESPTGMKIFATATPKTAEAASAFLRKVYEFYSDFVLKNPFYELDMPIRIRLFDHSVDKYARENGLAAASRT